MNKRDFIQRITIRSLPNLQRLDACVRYAESLWEGLDRLGYGGAKARGPRPAKNHYGALSEYQREWFNRFWDAFAYKHGKDRAALAWGKLGELTKDEYRRIVEAARDEALRPRGQGETRKMAEGWLSERRFEDRVVARRQATDAASRERRLLLVSELNALRQFQRDQPNDAQAARIEEIEAELRRTGEKG